jgi:hypothetical protein
MSIERERDVERAKKVVSGLISASAGPAGSKRGGGGGGGERVELGGD